MQSIIGYINNKINKNNKYNYNKNKFNKINKNNKYNHENIFKIIDDKDIDKFVNLINIQ